MIFITYENGKFTSADTDKRFTRMAFDVLVKPLTQRLGQAWFAEAQAELDGFGNLDLTDLSDDDFVLACRELEKSGKNHHEMSVLFDEIEPLLKADPRFQAA